jgi:tetratricopeptide (TPR) repeat protein
MKSFKTIFLVLLGLSCFSSSVTAHPAANVARGLDFLGQGKLELAERELQVARFAMPDNPVIKYNLGQVRYRSRKYDDASKFFSDAAKAAKSEDLKFRSFHNLGNSLYRAGDYAMAVEAYKNGLEIKEDELTEYNLKQAEKRLKEQMQRQQQQQQNSESSQQNQKNDQNDQNQQQSGQDQRSEQNEGNKSEKSENNQAQKQDSDQSQQQTDKEQNQSEKSRSSESQEQKNEEQQNQAGEQGEKEQPDNSQNREDVEMAQGEKKKEEPDESQRARALKNRKLNPYMVEKILRELQEREKQAQLYYRNDPQRQEQLDPFEMDARQLQEFFRNRGRRAPKNNEEPDW